MRSAIRLRCSSVSTEKSGVFSIIASFTTIPPPVRSPN
jgi:hypothetical protein